MQKSKTGVEMFGNKTREHRELFFGLSRVSVRSSRVVIGALTACLIALIPCVVSTPAHADSRSDLVEAQKRKQAEISQARQQLAGVNNEISQAYMQILEMENQIASAQIELKDAQDALGSARREAERVTSQLEAARGELNTIRQDIDEGNKKIADARDSLGVLARAQYRGDTTPSTMELLVGSSSASDFLDSFATSHAITRTQTTALTEVEKITARNKTRESRQVDVEKQIGELKERADVLVTQCEVKEKEAADKKTSLESLQNSLNTRVRNFESYGAQLQSQINTKQAESAQISAQIAAIDEANRKAQAAAAAQRQQSAGGVTSNSFIRPMVPGAVVTSHFGYRLHPILGYWRLHAGTDFAVGCGVPQYAPANATVSAVGYGDPGAGNYVNFDLGVVNGHSWRVRTLHLQKIMVSRGQRVTQGQVIGLTGMTGGATGCHVHQEVYMDGTPINPLLVF